LSEDDAPILIRVTGSGNTTITADDPDDAEYIYVDTEEEKDYLEYLKEKGKYSKIGLRSKLTGMREYEEWRENRDER